jgi:hypothetical protein
MQTLLILMHGFTHLHNLHALLRYDLHHHAIRFLLSGQTSESPANGCQARQLLTWLVLHRISPVDW